MVSLLDSKIGYYNYMYTIIKSWKSFVQCRYKPKCVQSGSGKYIGGLTSPENYLDQKP